jgi:hypothetical protein
MLWSRKNVLNYTTNIPSGKEFIEKFLQQRRKPILNGSVLHVTCKINWTVTVFWFADFRIGLSFVACFKEFCTELELLEVRTSGRNEGSSSVVIRDDN